MSEVFGLDKFIEHFKNFNDNYIIVGGSACSLLFNEVNIDFRATKDIDIIIITENINKEFGTSFWNFINDGGYDTYFSITDLKPHFYRFLNPKNRSYPKMIELFSRKQDIFESANSIFTPIKIDEEISSLSAILLDDDYYSFLKSGSIIVNGAAVLKPEFLICFKARAHVDLTNKKNNGIFVNEADSKKHKNDIFRLLTLLNEGDKFEIPTSVKNDLRDFLLITDKEKIDVEKLTNGALNYETAKRILKDIFDL